MVKYVCALLLVMVFAAPAFAQDVPQVELALGYGNIKMLTGCSMDVIRDSPPIRRSI